ncbi:apolipoprotein N-acyltransferase [Acidimangrovimonas sediminis]|uniref:apolipoprotein N-acyltransferase n=1 Tax=Acidimangrovimonas sediminis TaxID=2056283 RepID=UPI000C80A689|nr:apolipoprotein N-acyltransferase [Acidimangrovimonas sediminis]
MRLPEVLKAPARPAGRALLGAAALGALAALGQAPLGFWWATLAALALLTAWVARAPSVARAVWIGWFAGAGMFGTAMYWIVDPFLVDPARDLWMAPFAWLFLSFGMALFWALAAGVGRWLGRGAAGRAIGFALALAGTDLLRTYLFTGLPWALVGHVWVGTWLAQADIFLGPVGLSLMTTLAAALPAALGRVRGTAVSAVGLVAVAGFGAWRVSQPIPPRATPIEVRLIQPNATQSQKWNPKMQYVFWERLLKATAAPVAKGRPPLDLIVWPETSAPFLLNDPGAGLDMIAEAAQGVPVAFGVQRGAGQRYYNSLAVMDHKGDIEAIYDKHHLVPFGEYVPYGDLLAKVGVSAFAAQEGNGYTPGSGPAVLDLGPKIGKVLPLICYEAIFPADLLNAPGRADWILQVTNDAWFGNFAGPYQHLAQTRLRAIEEGLPFLRAANTGVTAVIDPYGRVLKSLPLNTQGMIEASVPGALAPPPYTRWGDWPVLWLILAGLAGVALIGRRGQRAT